MNQAELAREREYTQMVQGLLYSVINASKGNAAFQEESIQTILNDAWEEMRLKPTALSQQDIDQLQTEINRYAARKSFSEGRAAQYERMLANPFFARVDFTEEPDGTQETPPEKEKIVIGLYSLKDAERRIVVHDWRAPICSLYYDCLPGPASYVCPDGTIRGVLSLEAAVRDGQGKAQVLRGHRLLDRRQHAAGYPLGRDQQPHAPDRGHHPIRAERRHPPRQRARAVGHRRGGQRQDQRGHAPRGLPDVPLSRPALQRVHRGHFPQSGLQRVHLAGAALPGREEHPVAYRA